MYTARFFSTSLGRAALISIAAMAALNVTVLAQQLSNTPQAPVYSAVTSSDLA
jgi:hypothetical protein